MKLDNFEIFSILSTHNIEKAILDKSNIAFIDQPSTYLSHFLQRFITFIQCSSASTFAVYASRRSQPFTIPY